MSKPSFNIDHLSEEARTLFLQIFEDYELELHHTKILICALELFDRSNQARRILETEGLTFLDQNLQPKKRPEIEIEKSSKITMARLFRELNLDIEPKEARLPRR